MQRLYAPWRSPYSERVDKTKQEGASEEECIFCQLFKEQKNDDDNFVLKRFKHNLVILNRFPYNAGHLLIIPYAHKEGLEDLDKETRAELIELAAQATQILKKSLKTHGTNIGANIGKAAGAGIPSHFHMHILPRYYGDANFLPTLAETKQISFDLGKLFKKLKPAFNE